jgi:hypothetical protein
MSRPPASSGSTGTPTGAKVILIAQRRQARSKITGRLARSRRALDAAYNFAVGYGYRPARVLWALTALVICVTISLQIPGPLAAMRAATGSGAVYTVHGPAPQAARAGTIPAATRRPAAHRSHADACGNGKVRCFNAVLYAIDTVVPLISLDQRTTWYPDAHAPYGTTMQTWLNAAAIIGWLLSSIFVLSLANLARSL